MVSVNSTNVSVAANNPIAWQNGIFTACDKASSNGTALTLGRCGLYTIDFDSSVETAAADPSIALTLYVNGIPSNIGAVISTTAASTPVAGAFNTVLRVNTVPTTISVVSDSVITVDKAQFKAVHL
jgi:hypothetical protein